MLIENFVPLQEVSEMMHHLKFDDGLDDWKLIDKSKFPKANPGSTLGLRSPLCT